jgi:outer membrane PBP1 activator LpoA protein
MIALRNGSQSNVTLYASSRSAQGTAARISVWRWKVCSIARSRCWRQQPGADAAGAAAVRNDYSLARLYAWALMPGRWPTISPQMRQTPGFELNGNTGDLTATQDCVINRKLSWLKYQQGQIVAAN